MRRFSLLGLSLLALFAVLFWLLPSQHERLPLNDDPAPVTEQNNPSDWVQRQPNEKRSLPLDEAHMQQQDSESASVIVLQGWVTDLDTRPIAGATIFLRPSTALTRANPVQRDRILRERALGRISLLPPKVVAQAITNADGRYLIQVQALPPAVYQVVARQEDFAPQRQSWTWVGESDELDFQLGPGTSISGRVLDLDGSPLAGAEIEVLTQGDEGRGNWSGEAELIDQTRSDAGGYFRLGVYPGEFQLKAGAQGFAPLALRDIVAGSRDVQVRLSPGRRLTGIVLDQRGRPVPGAELALWLGEGVKHRFAEPVSLLQTAFSVPVARRTSDDEGKFQFEGLRAGAYGLLAQKGGFTPGVALGEIRQDNRVTTIELRLASGFFLLGRVIDLEGSPVPGALVAVVPNTVSNEVLHERREHARVAREQFLIREGRNEELQNWYARQVQRDREQPYQPISLNRAIGAVETDTQGRFRFDTLEEKVYDLSVVAADLLPRRLENVAVGQGATQLTVVLESGVRVEGRVFSSLTGSAISDAIVAVGKGAKRRLLSQTDRDGWYRIGGLLEKEIDQLTVRAEGFALRILDGIDVPAGSQVRRLDLALDPAVRVSGTVIDPAGIPVSGAWVHVEPVEQSLVLMAAGDEQYARDLRLVLRVSAQSDATGYFELDNVNPASSLELCVRHPEFQTRCIEPFEGISGQRLSAIQIQLE